MGIIQYTEKLGAAIQELNACGQSIDESRAVTFKPKNGDEARVLRVVREGLSDVGMNPGSRGFFTLGPSAIAALAPHGLNTEKAYNLGKFKNEAVFRS